MTAVLGPQIRLRVDPTNPGQFFACCGLVELADRLWNGSESWFENEGRTLCIRAIGADVAATFLLAQLRLCELGNTMTPEHLRRRHEIGELSKKQIEAAGLEDEKRQLDALWREAPVVVGGPFGLVIDWHIDERAGGSTFKTWAGQQSIIEIARGMQALIPVPTALKDPEECLFGTAAGDGLPFNFDSDLGGLGSDRDVGFSFDPLKEINVGVRPTLELCAFVGLQRCRPSRIRKENRYQYSTWDIPLDRSLVSAAAAGVLAIGDQQRFEFRLLYRTKYLKSFLPSKILRGDL